MASDVSVVWWHDAQLISPSMPSGPCCRVATAALMSPPCVCSAEKSRQTSGGWAAFHAVVWVRRRTHCVEGARETRGSQSGEGTLQRLLVRDDTERHHHRHRRRRHDGRHSRCDWSSGIVSGVP